jgi:hypothetical protein
MVAEDEAQDTTAKVVAEHAQREARRVFASESGDLVRALEAGVSARRASGADG